MAFLILAFFAWIPLALVVGSVGNNRQIGFWSAFFISLIFSPLVGLLVVLTSKSLQAQAYEQQVINLQRQQNQALTQMSQTAQTKSTNVATELLSLKQLKDAGELSEEEYQSLRKRILSDEPLVENNESFETGLDWFHKYAGPTLTHKMLPDQELTLVRDSSFQNAIQVHLGGLPIGYVPSEVADLIDPKLARGKSYQAAISRYDRSAPTAQRVKIKIWSV